MWTSSRHPAVIPVVTRAMVHSVTDETNKDYLKTIAAALDHVERGVRAGDWSVPTSLLELDHILAVLVDDLIYNQRKGPSYGQNSTRRGVMCIRTT